MSVRSIFRLCLVNGSTDAFFTTRYRREVFAGESRNPSQASGVAHIPCFGASFLASALTGRAMFDIVTSQDFLNKLDAEYADFKAQPDSTRHALNFIMTAYHLHATGQSDCVRRGHIMSRKPMRNTGKGSPVVRLAIVSTDKGGSLRHQSSKGREVRTFPYRDIRVGRSRNAVNISCRPSCCV
jgi:hypothetical protein